MSQVGTLISVGPWNWLLGDQSLTVPNIWQVQYSYQLDSGGIGQSSFLTGMGGVRSNLGLVMPFWASASATITVSPNPPGTSSPVVLACPALIAWAAFGLPLK